ncbi:MAG: DMT family transporter, partial [Desulfuromusa sp.]
RIGTWLGAILAAVGLYFLSITKEFNISFGDLLVLIGAFFWAGHVLLIGWLAPRTNSLKLAAAQFAVCSLLSLLVALAIETMSIASIWQAAVPILYGGIGSVGIAYTLQVIAQRDAHPAHSAIILSLEGLFAAIGGWLLLGEVLSLRGLFGCAMMLAGMLFSELSGFFGKRKPGI